MKILFTPLVALLLWATAAHAQNATQIKPILPGTVSLTFAWDFPTVDEPNIDDFVIQRTAFALNSTITSPYSVEQIQNNRAARTYTYTLPTNLTAGQKAFFRVITRKQGMPDGQPSNIVEVDVVATPPPATNFRIQ